jgi:glycosyltransferase involved in cell wall biosynthesis
VVTIHDLILHFFPGNKLNKPHQRAAYKLVLNSALKKAERVIAVSNSTKNDLVKISKTNPEKIRVIYEAANEDFHLLENQNSKYKTLLKYNISKPFILYTGVWRVHKNLPNLIKAFHILKQDYRLNYNLVITGKRDDTYPEVVDEIASLGLEKDVILTGMVEEDELVSFYNCAECYAFPSLYEGFGLPVLEAMACALPVVCSDSSSLPEVCGEGNAVFFNPRSPKDMAEKIAEVCLNKELQDELKARGLERVKDFSWRRMAEETLKVYQEIF